MGDREDNLERVERAIASEEEADPAPVKSDRSRILLNLLVWFVISIVTILVIRSFGA